MKVPASVMYKNLVSPSADFTDRLMLKIARVDQQRRAFYDGLAFIVLFSPLILRQLWLAVFRGHDYFAIGHWPASSVFLQTYSFLLSQLAIYLFFGLGTILVGLYLLFEHFGSRWLMQIIKPALRLAQQVRLRV